MPTSDNLQDGMTSTAVEAFLKLEEGLPLPRPSNEQNIEHYLYERYASDAQSWKRKAYYLLKPWFPRPLQLTLRRKYVSVQARGGFPSWPIEPILVDVVQSYMKSILTASGREAVHRISPWPNEKRFAFAITHDVEWDAGLRHAHALAAIEKRYGLVSSWNIVPERYPIDWKIVDRLRAEGSEIGIHGLKHDGKLFQSRRIFEQRAMQINRYAKEWKAVGFRSPSTLRNVDWMSELEVEYDSSFPDTDPYEPQPGGCCSIWPFFIQHLVELPLTMPQDHTLFEILGMKDISLWKTKADWIERHGGLILINIHPDYMFSPERLSLYESFLQHMTGKAAMWHALPMDIARWWRNRDSSRLSQEGGYYAVDGAAAMMSSILRTSASNETVTDQFLNLPHR
jgi:hypothetical protein